MSQAALLVLMEQGLVEQSAVEQKVCPMILMLTEMDHLVDFHPGAVAVRALCYNGSICVHTACEANALLVFKGTSLTRLCTSRRTSRLVIDFGLLPQSDTVAEIIVLGFNYVFKL